jgi:hypothetical protein
MFLVAGVFMLHLKQLRKARNLSMFITSSKSGQFPLIYSSKKGDDSDGKTRNVKENINYQEDQGRT